MPERQRCRERDLLGPSEREHAAPPGRLQRLGKGDQEPVPTVAVGGEIGAQDIGRRLRDGLAVDRDRDLNPLLRRRGIPAPPQDVAVRHTLQTALVGSRSARGGVWG